MPRPYTIKFGAWLPDLQNVGVEMPMQWTETALPCADCLNVYYQDAAYRCLPAPQAIGPTLGTPILDAFTWYDDTQGKEIIFAATANGFYTLIDGAWSAIPTETQETALGLAIGISLGSPVGLATAVTPTSETASGSGSSYTFPALKAVIGAGTATSYTWSFTGVSGSGSWSIASGQGTSTAVPKVTGATAGATSSATCRCTMVVAGVTYVNSAALSYAENSFTPTNHTYTGDAASVETIPDYASQVVIEGWGGGASGGAAYGAIDDSWGGGGGGAGGYFKKTITLTSAAWGKTINVSATHAAENISVTSGTFSLSTLTADTGGTGGNASSGHGGTGGSGGGASGGDVNTTGGSGSSGSFNNLGTGGGAVTGVYAGPYGNGGSGALYGGEGAGSGGNGGVNFHYT